MKINKQITDNVTAKVNELKLTLTNATIELLGMAFDENTDIKLEKPIDITETSTDDKGRVKVETFIVDHILFKRGEVVDGRTFDGYYLLCLGETCLASSTFLGVDNYIKVYEEVRKLIRHK